MNLLLRRKRNNGDTTIGELKDEFISMATLEDEPRTIKVAGETRIPAGTFEIVQRRVLSPLTQKYRERFEWFRWHLMLLNVPGFDYVYIHIGNTEADTEACILVGEKPQGWAIEQSLSAYRRLYHYIMGAFAAGDRVFISILDEDV